MWAQIDAACGGSVAKPGRHDAVSELGRFAGTCIELEPASACQACYLPSMRRAEGVLTDLPWLLPLVEENVSANFDQGDERRPQTCALRWGCASDCAALPSAPQLVVGSDVVYVEQDLPRLLDTLATLGGAVNLISQQHRGGFRRNALLDAAKALGGWDVTRLRRTATTDAVSSC